MCSVARNWLRYYCQLNVIITTAQSTVEAVVLAALNPLAAACRHFLATEEYSAAKESFQEVPERLCYCFRLWAFQQTKHAEVALASMVRFQFLGTEERFSAREDLSSEVLKS
jgi:hypothetical protein